MTLSAVIITKNEERNIGRCLQSLVGVADEVIVVDSGSADGTKQICNSYNSQFPAFIFQFHEWCGYSEQKNYADSLATCDWTFSIDADEALSPELRESLLMLKKQNPQPTTIYSLNRLTNYCGHWIHHCGWYPDSRIRLWPTGQASWEGKVHEQLTLHSPISNFITPPIPPRGGTKGGVIHLKGDLHHYSYYTVAEHEERIMHYARLSAEEKYARGKHTTRAALFFRPLWTFVRNYILKGGFLDGKAGYTVCRLSATYTFTKYSTLLRMWATAR